MNTTIAIDKKTKEKAEKRAKKEGISVSTLVRIFLNDYASGKINVGVAPSNLTENGFTPEFENEILEAAKDPETYGPFDSAEEAIGFLRRKRS
jgi:antitoxin component of RelBE/YafQ-DinJ toxin-antitoxin module